MLLARQETSYDDRGRVYLTRQYAVNPADGTVGPALVGRTWYDPAGNTIKSQSAGSQAFTKTLYDGLGRPIKQYVGYDPDESTYAEAASLEGDTILKQTETEYDAAGNAVFVTTRQRYHNATGSGELTDPSGAEPKARVTYTAMYYDEIGRPLATANYGTNGSVAPTRPATVPARSDDVLVTSTAYGEAGMASKTIDAAGREHR